MTDHYATALEWLEEADDEYTREPPIRENIRESYQRAQAHATLALVDAQREANEQARIANVIALAGVEDLNGWKAEGQTYGIYTYDDSGEPELRDDIKKGLRL